MPRQISPESNFWARLRGDALSGNGSGDDAANPLAFEQFNRDIGQTSDASATSDTGTFSLIALFKRSLTRLTILATAPIIAPTAAVTTASNHLALANTSATPLAGTSTLCESVALFPQRADGTANAAPVFVGLTAARQRVEVTPGTTIGPFPGRRINLQDVRIQGTAGDGVEFWVVQ